MSCTRITGCSYGTLYIAQIRNLVKSSSVRRSDICLYRFDLCVPCKRMGGR